MLFAAQILPFHSVVTVRKPDDVDKLRASAAENGSEMVKHIEKDADPCLVSYDPKIIDNQDIALKNYVL